MVKIESPAVDVDIIVEEIVDILDLTYEELKKTPGLETKKNDVKDILEESRNMLEYRRRRLTWLATSLISVTLLLGDISAVSKLEGRQFESLIIGLICSTIFVLSLVRAIANSRNVSAEKKKFIRDGFRLQYFVNTPNDAEVEEILQAVAGISSIARRIQATNERFEKPKRERLELDDDGELVEYRELDEVDSDDADFLISNQ